MSISVDQDLHIFDMDGSDTMKVCLDVIPLQVLNADHDVIVVEVFRLFLVELSFSQLVTLWLCQNSY